MNIHFETDVFSIPKPRGHCLNPRCHCHSGQPSERVCTPFPIEAGPPYCCSRCSSVRCALPNTDGTIKTTRKRATR